MWDEAPDNVCYHWGIGDKAGVDAAWSAPWRGISAIAAMIPPVVISPAQPAQGAPLWSSSFLPAAYQGTRFRAMGDPIVDLKPPAGLT